MCLQSYGSGRRNCGKWDEWKTEAMAHQGNHNTLDNGMDEPTSAFLIHCHPRQHRVFFIKQSVVYFVSHMGATQVAFESQQGWICIAFCDAIPLSANTGIQLCAITFYITLHYNTDTGMVYAYHDGSCLLPSCHWYSLCIPTDGWPGWVDLGSFLASSRSFLLSSRNVFYDYFLVILFSLLCDTNMLAVTTRAVPNSYFWLFDGI